MQLPLPDNGQSRNGRTVHHAASHTRRHRRSGVHGWCSRPACHWRAVFASSMLSIYDLTIDDVGVIVSRERSTAQKSIRERGGPSTRPAVGESVLPAYHYSSTNIVLTPLHLYTTVLLRKEKSFTRFSYQSSIRPRFHAPDGRKILAPGGPGSSAPCTGHRRPSAPTCKSSKAYPPPPLAAQRPLSRRFPSLVLLLAARASRPARVTTQRSPSPSCHGLWSALSSGPRVSSLHHGCTPHHRPESPP